MRVPLASTDCKNNQGTQIEDDTTSPSLTESFIVKSEGGECCLPGHSVAKSTREVLLQAGTFR